MSLELLNTIDVIAIMENYVERIRPEPHIREKLDIGYRIDNQSIVLFEVRPKFRSSNEIIEAAYAKATYIKSEKKWKVYWMRGNLKWTLYEANPKVASLQKFIDLVEEDQHHCFKG